MPDIELSVMIHTRETEKVLRGLLDEFEAQSGVHVNLTPLQWSKAHAELNRTALYHRGPDISEIGSTWVSDLIAMNALRPFSTTEINLIGKPDEFITESWNTGHLVDEGVQWAIPWLAESYVIHYRQDLLKLAGVDEATAFTSHTQLTETINKLQKCDLPVPIEFPLNLDTFGNLHVLASWVWTNGGDFCTPNGKQVLFDQPAALTAMQAYFTLLRQLTPSARQKLRDREGSLFTQGQSAINFGTLMFFANRASAPAEVRENWRAASLPGAHFMGGSNLVVWKHTRNEKAALELIRFLTCTPIQPRLALPLATLPPRLSALDLPEIAQDPYLSVFAQSLRTGRSYYNVPLWGLIEDRLETMLLQMGMKVLSDEDFDMNAYIAQQTDMLARRLNITLSQ